MHVDRFAPFEVGAGRLALADAILARGPSFVARVACGERVVRGVMDVRYSLRLPDLGRAAPLLVRLSTRKLTFDLPAFPSRGGR